MAEIGIKQQECQNIVENGESSIKQTIHQYFIWQTFQTLSNM